MFKLANIRTGKKLGLGFGVVVAITLIVGLIGVVTLRDIISDFEYIGSNRLPDLKTLGELNYHRMIIRADTLSVSLTRDMQDPTEELRALIANRKRSWEIIDQNWAALNAIERYSDRGRSILADLQTEYRAWREIYGVLDQIVEQLSRTDNFEARERLYEEYEQTVRRMVPISDRMGESFNLLTENNMNNTALIIEAETAKAQLSQWINIFGMLVGIILAIVLGVVITRSVSIPIRKGVGLLQAISEGKLTEDVREDLLERKDEIGDLAKAMKKMVDSLRGQIQSIMDVSGSLSAAASQIAASVSQMASGAQESAAAVAETTTTMEEVKQTSNSTNQKAREVAENAQKGLQVAQSGRKTTDSLSQAMQKINEQMNSIADTILKLSEQTQSISEINATVEDISEQSNLLAVNASVEAAKAGEYGKGFGVVAQEIKNLAEQSKQATKQVRNILRDIQKATSTAVMVTEQGSKAVDEGVKMARETGDAIQALSKGFAESSQSAAMIAAANRELLTGVDQVAQSMVDIKETSSQNASGMKQLDSAARSLKELGASLSQLIKRYTL